MTNSRQRLTVNKNFVTILINNEELKIDLDFKQQPQHCRILIPGEKVERRPLEPAPIIQLSIKNKDGTTNKDSFSSASLFMKASVEDLDKNSSRPTSNKNSINSSSIIFGSLVSSLQLVKDLDKNEIGLFVFPNISLKVEGLFRLKFELFDLKEDGNLVKITQIEGQPFRVFSAEKFPGWEPTTQLTHLLSSQGVKVNLRKRNHVTLHNSNDNNSNNNNNKLKSQKMISNSHQQQQKIGSSLKTNESSLLLPKQNLRQTQPRDFMMHQNKKILIAPQNFQFLFPMQAVGLTTNNNCQFQYVKSDHKLSSIKPKLYNQQQQQQLNTFNLNSTSTTSSNPSSPSLLTSPTSHLPQNQLNHAEVLLSLGSQTQTNLPSKDNSKKLLPSFFELVNSINPV